jgi:hypothetical protein
MADTADKTKNWADMDHDEGEDEHEELGLQGAGAKKEEEVKKETTEQAPAQTGDKPYKKQRKDYGAAYDPNYKKNKWRKGGAEEFKKNVAPAVPRQKNERGDYVVTSFVIPERKDAIKGADNVSDHLLDSRIY